MEPQKRSWGQHYPPPKKIIHHTSCARDQLLGKNPQNSTLTALSLFFGWKKTKKFGNELFIITNNFGSILFTGFNDISFVVCILIGLDHRHDMKHATKFLPKFKQPYLWEHSSYLLAKELNMIKSQVAIQPHSKFGQTAPKDKGVLGLECRTRGR